MSLKVFNVSCQENTNYFYCHVAAASPEDAEDYMTKYRSRYSVLFVDKNPIDETDGVRRLIQMKAA